MPAYLDDVLGGLAACRERVALIRGDRRITAGAVLRAVHRTAFALRDCGVRHGGSVVHLAANSPEAVIARLATQLCGAYYAGLHPESGVRDQADRMAQLNPDLVVTDPSAVPGAAQAVSGAECEAEVVVLGESPGRPDLLALAAGNDGERFPCPAAEDDLAQVTFSSGSTGPAKALPHTFAHAATFLAMSRYLHGRTARRFLLAAPLAFLAGEHVYWALADGGSAVLHDRHTADSVVAALAEHRVTHLFDSLPHHVRMWEHPQFAAHSGSLQQVGYGGMYSSPQLVREALRRLDCELQQTYGLWEAGFVTVLSPQDHRDGAAAVPGAVGTPLPGVSIEVRDRRGQRLPAGQIGQVWVHHPARTASRWNTTPDPADDGWLHTGDLGELDERGYLTLAGRDADTVHVAGRVIFAHQVEDLLTEHPQVREAAVFGVGHETTGEAVHAVVVAERPPPAAELRNLIEQHVGLGHHTATVEFATALPTTSSGKTDKQRLRAAAVRQTATPCDRPERSTPCARSNSSGDPSASP